jgi:hypothetical protein
MVLMKEISNTWKVVIAMVALGIMILTVATDMNDPDVGAFGDDDYTKDSPRNDAVTMHPVPTATTTPTSAIDDIGDDLHEK